MVIQLQDERTAERTKPDESPRVKKNVSTPAEPGAGHYLWTDRVAFWFWLGCALLMATMIVFDTVKSLAR